MSMSNGFPKVDLSLIPYPLSTAQEVGKNEFRRPCSPREKEGIINLYNKTSSVLLNAQHFSSVPLLISVRTFLMLGWIVSNLSTVMFANFLTIDAKV